ncbi:MAG TPA: cob(I)yrinic acid a,c-diamide adenosyltransferase [Acidimicrobiales bacterium]|nr:cob(I)yrinic acid a,c-diamide adenosyltransferase [Acidimicrobiales bacterium]
MTRLWTGKGDDGTSGLLYGGREPKSSPRFDAIGAVDEAQAAIGVARAELAGWPELDAVLVAAERDLWVLMGELATDDANRAKLEPGTSLVSPEMVTGVERAIEDAAAGFELPREFVVPGQDRASALLDLARTVVRRAERAATTVAADGSHVIPYLNRLSSLLWTLARKVEGEPLRSREA